jgi:nucleotide-binding universal stress UspA family protein
MLRAEDTNQRRLREIPLDAIVGSVGRYADFTRGFLPRHETDKQRWADVKVKALYKGGFPPIDVYQVGEVYFVLDGNHRVSVARQLGATTIQAYVTEVRTRVPLTPDVQPDELIIKARYADFLERYGLDRTRPGADLSVTAAGQYRILEEQIEAYRRQVAFSERSELGTEEAAARWYDDKYLPVVEMLCQIALVDEFPGRTETDLYLWVTERREELEHEVGWKVPPNRVAVDLAESRSRRLPRVKTRWHRRLRSAVTPAELVDGPRTGTWRQERAATSAAQRLFPDILVPVSGTSRSWQALEQALVVARREGSALHGFHVVRSEADLGDERTWRVQQEFDRRCQAAGVAGSLVTEVGPVARTICERAHWTDLVIANLAFPPGSGVARRLGSGFHTLVRRCSRPLLAVPRVSLLKRALLAFDGSPKSVEALYVATYLAGHWQASLAVVSVDEQARPAALALEDARAYVERHGVQADYLERTGLVTDAILDAAAEWHADVILLGGYGYTPVLEAVLGSSVDRLLRESRQPMLICR